MGSRRRRLVAGGAAGAVALGVGGLAPPVVAAGGDYTVYEVRTEADLRSAITEANSSPDQDRIKLRSSIVLTDPGTDADGPEAGDLDVTADLIVFGTGRALNANGVDRVFDVADVARLRVVNTTLEGGAPADGASGGAVRSAGRLVFEGSRATGNTVAGAGASGGALLNDGGVLTVTGSWLRENTAERAGGGIEALGGTTTVHDSTLTANTAGPGPGNGGGLHLTGAGSVRVTDSMVARNVATAEGGGLWSSADGRFVVADSVVRWNRAEGAEATNGGGGLFNDGGELTVRRSQVVGNAATGDAGSGGGLLNDQGTLVVNRSVVQDNDAPRAGGGIESNLGSVRLDRTDLVRNGTGDAPGNGGGLHLTGAGEVSVAGGEVIGNEAASEGGGLWNSATGAMDVSGVRLQENLAAGAAADNGGGALFNDGGRLSVDHAVIRLNSATGTAGSGGAILNNRGSLTVTDSKLGRNDAPRAGGGIETNVGAVTLDDVRLLRNRTGASPGNGGGLHVTGGGVVGYAGGRVYLNSAASEGGGLWNSSTGRMLVEGVKIEDNAARGDAADNGGGGLFNDGGTLVVRDSVVRDNSATGVSGSGGGVLNNLGSLRVVDSLVVSNDAQRAGGGIETNAGSVTLRRVDLRDNLTGVSPGNGGGLHVTGAGEVDYVRGVVRGNRATAEGGGLWNSSTGTVVTSDVTLRGNRAPVGPNVYTQPGGTLVVDGEVISAGDNDFSN